MEWYEILIILCICISINAHRGIDHFWLAIAYSSLLTLIILFSIGLFQVEPLEPFWIIELTAIFMFALLISFAVGIAMKGMQILIHKYRTRIK